MLAQSIAPDPARAGWLSGSRALVVMQGGEKVSPKGSAFALPLKSLRDSWTERINNRASNAELNGAKCTVAGCGRPSCLSPDERANGVPDLCAGCFDDVAYGLGGAA